MKNPTPLINLDKFDIIEGMVPDHMHITTEIGNQFSKEWFDNKTQSSSFVTKQKIEEVNCIMNSIKSPRQIGRLSRSLVKKEFWKVREWEN